MLSEELPDELLPFKGRLSPRFFEARRDVVAFVRDDVLPVLPEYHRQRKALEQQAPHPTQAPMPAMHKVLQAKAKSRGLYNFFLPAVCGLSTLEYVVGARVYLFSMHSLCGTVCLGVDSCVMTVVVTLHGGMQYVSTF